MHLVSSAASLILQGDIFPLAISTILQKKEQQQKGWK